MSVSVSLSVTKSISDSVFVSMQHEHEHTQTRTRSWTWTQRRTRTRIGIMYMALGVKMFGLQYRKYCLAKCTVEKFNAVTKLTDGLFEKVKCYDKSNELNFASIKGTDKVLIKLSLR